jgi:hypothetical protein
MVLIEKTHTSYEAMHGRGCGNFVKKTTYKSIKEEVLNYKEHPILKCLNEYNRFKIPYLLQNVKPPEICQIYDLLLLFSEIYDNQRLNSQLFCDKDKVNIFDTKIALTLLSSFLIDAEIERKGLIKGVGLGELQCCFQFGQENPMMPFLPSCDVLERNEQQKSHINKVACKLGKSGDKDKRTFSNRPLIERLCEMQLLNKNKSGEIQFGPNKIKKNEFALYFFCICTHFNVTLSELLMHELTKSSEYGTAKQYRHVVIADSGINPERYWYLNRIPSFVNCSTGIFTVRPKSIPNSNDKKLKKIIAEIRNELGPVVFQQKFDEINKKIDYDALTKAYEHP